MSTLAIDYGNPIKNKSIAIYKVQIHVAEEGGYWAVCDIPGGGCTTQGETLREIQKNMYEAVELFLDDIADNTDFCLMFEVKHA